MNGSKLKVLTAIAGVLALGEFGSAVMIWLEKYPGSIPAAGVMFGVFFLLATWLLRSGRVTAGAVFAGVLCLFEVVSFSGWTRHSALDWIYQTTFAVVSVAGLIAAVVVLAGRIRRRAAA
jgi:roadblock/LC7 domain-containing protein